METQKTVTFRTVTQAAIFECELKGQISDGMWENTSGTGWAQWCATKVLVGNDVGRNFYPQKDNFNFARKDLVDIVGKRMSVYAKLAKMGIPLDEIRFLGDGLFGLDGEWHGVPDYPGEYWDAKREKLNAMDLVDLKARFDATTYTDFHRANDLKDIKKAVRVMV